MRVRTQRVPAGYRELEYIYQNKNGTSGITNLAYIQFNLSFADIDSVEFDLAIFSEGGVERNIVLCAYDTSYYIVVDKTYRNISYGFSSSATWNPSDSYLFSDELRHQVKVSGLSSSNTTKLRTAWDWTWWHQTYWYGIKFYKNNNLLCNFIPVERQSDSKPGLYDTVNNVFYTNSGTGEFIKGPYKDSYNCPVIIQEGTTNLLSTNYYNYVPSNYNATYTTLSEKYMGNPIIHCVGTSSTNSGFRYSVSTSLGVGKSVTYSIYLRYNGSKTNFSVYFGGYAAGSYRDPLINRSLSNGGTGQNNWVKETITIYDTHHNEVAWSDITIDTWYYIVTTVTNIYSDSISVNNYYFLNGSNTGTWDIACPQIEIKDHATPYVNGTRPDNYIQSGSPKINLLPVEYQGVEYIESTGTQHIDTGLSMPNGFKLKCELLFPNQTNNGFFGAQDYIGGKFYRNFGAWVWQKSNNLFQIGIGAGGYATSDYVLDITTKHKIECSTINNNRYVKIDGNDIALVVRETLTTNLTSGHLTLFGLNLINNGTVQKFTGKSYGMVEVYDNNNSLVRNFIPCYRKSDSVIGMYDTIGKQFYTNSGTGTFTKGPDKNYII